MKLHCLECEREFNPNQFSVHIIGPDVQVNCPFCSYEYKGKFTSFVRDQMVDYKPNCPTTASWMIRLAKYMELNSSEYYKKKGMRHGKKKVRNVRN